MNSSCFYAFLRIFIWYCAGVPEAETGGEPGAEKGGGLAAEPELGGPDLAAPLKAGEMKSENLQKKSSDLTHCSKGF